MHNTTRRRVLKSGVIAAAGSWLAGCGGGGSGSASDFTSGVLPGATAPVTRPLPRWAAAAARGCWVEIPMAANLSDVDPMRSPLFNPNYPNAPEWAENIDRQREVVSAWCGAAFDEANDTMWLGLGGGHRNYAGNEVYCCDFFTEAPAWRMLRPPSGAVGNLLTTNDGQEASGVYADGRPRAVHSYNKWVHVPDVGPVLATHGAGSWRVNGAKTWAIFVDPVSGETTYTAEPPSSVINANRSEGTGACYDIKRHAIWIVEKNTSAVVRYDLPTHPPHTTGNYVQVGATWTKLAQVGICHLPQADVLLVLQSSSGSNADPGIRRLTVFDCMTGMVFTPNFLGSIPPDINIGLAQPRWVAALGAVCLWNNRSGTASIVEIKPGGDPRTEPWSIGTLELSVANTVAPTVADMQGTFGRFAHSPQLGGFVLINSTTGPTFFHKT